MEIGLLLRAGSTDRLIGLYVILWNLAGSSLGTDTSIKDVCGTEKFEPRCPEGEVVVMETALFGRMSMGRCVRENYGRLGCSVDVRRYLDTLCSGKQSCTVKVPDDHLLAMKPCSELYSYLEASYNCVKVLSSVAYQESCREEGYVKVAQDHGVISSMMVSQLAGSAGGLHGCPWVIMVQPGQRVNITLMDFGPEIETDHRPTCQKYGIIRERGVDSHTTVCSGPQRERNIYLSQTDRVELEFMLDSARKFKADFLLKFNVVGCATPPLRGHTLERHTVSSAVLHCPHNNQRLSLDCNGSNWVGYMEECTAPATSWSIWRVLSEEWSSPQGIAITVGLGVALGTVIGVSLLVCVLVFLKRHRMQKLAKAVKMADYEEGEYGATEELSRKWSNSDTLKSIGYSRTDGTSSLYKDSQYSQVWNAEPVRVTNDSGFGEGRDLPSRPLTSMMKPTPASPAGLVDIYERSDHVYERPK